YLGEQPSEYLCIGLSVQNPRKRSIFITAQKFTIAAAKKVIGGFSPLIISIGLKNPTSVRI
ncbi:hypothetical protein DVA76_18425, partial [Acinetobacter baumannii]